jgi:hypothetical protein
MRDHPNGRVGNIHISVSIENAHRRLLSSKDGCAVSFQYSGMASKGKRGGRVVSARANAVAFPSIRADACCVD